ncbi:MAG: hypothetical protein HZA63_04310 [Rhodocyclales bacterium]|nr:hypothetical protein [Rhodocyclales bacterium]
MTRQTASVVSGARAPTLNVAEAHTVNAVCATRGGNASMPTAFCRKQYADRRSSAAIADPAWLFITKPAIRSDARRINLEISVGPFGLLSMADRVCYLRAGPSIHHDIWQAADRNPQSIH